MAISQSAMRSISSGAQPDLLSSCIDIDLYQDIQRLPDCPVESGSVARSALACLRCVSSQSVVPLRRHLFDCRGADEMPLQSEVFQFPLFVECFLHIVFTKGFLAECLPEGEWQRPAASSKPPAIGPLVADRRLGLR